MTAVTFALVLSSSAAAQPAPNTAPVPAVHWSGWTLLAGYETLAFRDLARSDIPMDGSPSTLQGVGPVVGVRYERARRGRLHRFEGALARDSGFQYETASRQLSLPSSDHATSIDGRYEYRAYPKSDIIVRGLDLGLGVQGLAARRTIDRRYEPSLEFSRSESEVGAAGVLAGRLARWPRVQLEVAWTLGMAVARSHQSHSSGTGIDESYWGGGWNSVLSVDGRIPISAGLYLAGGYVFGERWRMSNHHTYAARRHTMTLGVTYGR